MASVVADIEVSAKWIATALTSSGYAADFSIESLRETDRFFDEHTVKGNARPGGLLSKDLGARLFALGAYTGEVIRLIAGGEWRSDDNDRRAEINVVLALPGGRMIFPVQRVMKRLTGGADESLENYARLVLGRPS